MSEILKIIQERQSARAPFDPNRKVSKENLKQILGLRRWAPTAHNMQNFEIVVVEDKEILEKIGNIKSRISEEFLRENYEQLSFSKEELMRKKTGILGTMFPPSWVDPSKIAEVARKATPMPLTQSLRGSPTLLIVIYDSRKRAPASARRRFRFHESRLRNGEHVAYGAISGYWPSDSQLFRSPPSRSRHQANSQHS